MRAGHSRSESLDIPTPPIRMRLRAVAHRPSWRWLACAVLLAGCAREPVHPPGRSAGDVRAAIVHLLPAGTPDRAGWAIDIQNAFSALKLEPDDANLCAVLAVTAQESGFQVDPVVPGMGRIARAEIDRRAAAHHVPQLLVRTALALHGPDGESYGARLAAARTERDLSRIYEDFIGMVPLGKRLFGDANPVHTAGPMQVSIAFAEAFSDTHGYPYPIDGSIRHEVFSRRGGLYFGIAHLLAYPAPYTQPLYRFADYNAGWYASRNAAFQHALSIASASPLALDGDLVRYDSSDPGSTELAARKLGSRLSLSDAQIHRALGLGESPDFAQTPLYREVFARAANIEGRPLPPAMLPQIRLSSPKITRRLTTAWFAQRVDQRYRQCMARSR